MKRHHTSFCEQERIWQSAVAAATTVPTRLRHDKNGERLAHLSGNDRFFEIENGWKSRVFHS